MALISVLVYYQERNGICGTWSTSVNGPMVDVEKYFIGEMFNIGFYPVENMAKVYDVRQFIDQSSKDFLIELKRLELRDCSKSIKLYEKAALKQIAPSIKLLERLESHKTRISKLYSELSRLQTQPVLYQSK